MIPILGTGKASTRATCEFDDNRGFGIPTGFDLEKCVRAFVCKGDDSRAGVP